LRTEHSDCHRALAHRNIPAMHVGRQHKRSWVFVFQNPRGQLHARYLAGGAVVAARANGAKAELIMAANTPNNRKSITI